MTRSDLTALLEHTDWLSVLAIRLAADRQVADDLVQDAWVAALERPPEVARPIRGWLATVLRHRWTDVRREERRRRTRERAAARAEALPSAHDVVEKAATQRRLVDAVLRLDEPFRTTVLLRFFEGLPQREIARRMQTSAATVNGRLRRALASLREQLAREGGRASWLQILVPLLAAPAPAPVGTFVAMKTIAAAIVAVTLTVFTGIALFGARSAAPQDVAGTAQRGAAARAPARDGPAAARADRMHELPAAARSQVAGPAPVVPAVAPPRTGRVVRGRVLDPSGAGLAGVALATAPARVATACTSGPGGAFALHLAAGESAETIVADDPLLTTVRAGSATVRGDTEATVVVAPRLELSGIVLDEARTPLAGAAVELRVPRGFGAAWGVVLDHSVPQQWRALTGGDGRFALAAAPAIAGAELLAARAGFAPHRAPAPQGSAADLEIVLARPVGAAGLVHGVVLDAAGLRAEGARVSAGDAIAETDVSGEFTLDVRTEATRDRLLALRAGALPAVFEPERDAAGRPRWPAEVVLQLGAPPGALAGRVLDAEGTPIAGARVWVDDPTPFGREQGVRLCAETLLRGEARFWSFQVTDADGAFRLEGLLPRPYRVQAVDPATLASAESDAVAPGDAAVELRLPTHDVYERIAGRVVTAAGEPIAGVTVRLFRVTYELPHESGVDNDLIESTPVITGVDGRFSFHDVPKQDVHVIVTGDAILGASATPAEERDPEHIEIVASRRLHLQVVLHEPHDRADRLRVLDAGGNRVFLSEFHGQGAHAAFEMPIHEGRSSVLAVDERAATLVLCRGATEVARLPLQLTPGRTNIVRG